MLPPLEQTSPPLYYVRVCRETENSPTRTERWGGVGGDGRIKDEGQLARCAFSNLIFQSMDAGDSGHLTAANGLQPNLFSLLPSEIPPLIFRIIPIVDLFRCVSVRFAISRTADRLTFCLSVQCAASLSGMAPDDVEVSSFPQIAVF